MRAAPKREHLLDTAEALFSKEGFKGVPVDRLLSDAGVAKMTLYKAFDSKDALIRETLIRRAARLAAHTEEFIEKAGPDPTKRLLSCFDAMAVWSKRDDFNGCYFVNALGEFGDPDGEEAKIVRNYKRSMLALLRTLCQPVIGHDSGDLARAIMLLIDGAIVQHMTLGDSNSYGRAKGIAASLIAGTVRVKKPGRDDSDG